MASYKTYSKKTLPMRRNSLNVFDALFAENISKRKQAQGSKKHRTRKPIVIKDLPPPDEYHHLMEDSVSRNWGLDDTFDRLRKAPTSSRIDTLDKSVNVSLYVEKVPVIQHRQLSFLTSPSNVEDSFKPKEKENSVNSSVPALFSNTFREHVCCKMHIASTPAVTSSTPAPVPPNSNINETISPILNPSSTRELIESYEEINNWNYKPPEFEQAQVQTPKTKKRRLKPKKLQKPKQTKKLAQTKNTIQNAEKDIRTKPDWKLKVEPKVAINTSVDILGIESVLLPNLGFSPESDDLLKKHSLMTDVFEESFQDLCRRHDDTFGTSYSHLPVRRVGLKKRYRRASSTNNKGCEDSEWQRPARMRATATDTNSPPRYITLRSRKVRVAGSEDLSETNKTDLDLSSSYSNHKNSSTNNEDCSVSNVQEESSRMVATVAVIRGQDDQSQSCAVLNRDQLSITPDSVEISIIKPNRTNLMTASIKSNVANNDDLIQDTLGVIEDSACSEADNVLQDRIAMDEYLENDTWSIATNGSVNENEEICDADYEQDIIFVHSCSINAQNDDDLQCLYSSKNDSIWEIHNYSKNFADLDDPDVIEVSSDEEVCNRSFTESAKLKVKPIEPKLELDTDDDTEDDLAIDLQLALDDEEESLTQVTDDNIQCTQANEIQENLVPIDESKDAEETTPDIPFKKPKLLELSSSKSLELRKSDPNDDDLQLALDESLAEVTNDKIHCTQANEIEEKSIPIDESELTTPFKKPRLLVLRAGKSYRRSLLGLRKSFQLISEICLANTGCICTCTKCNEEHSPVSGRWIQNRRLSVKIVAETPSVRQEANVSILESYASCNINVTPYGSDTTHDSVYQERSIGEPPLSRANSIHESTPIIKPSVSARDIILRRCGQTEQIPFQECYPASMLQNCYKVGEGVYGEVFLFRNRKGTTSVIKVIPIEGDQMVNGEHQKKFEEILSEVIIAMELSNLRNDKKNRTSGFSEVQNIHCVQGCYPDRLLQLWEEYDDANRSENDSPEMFKSDQLYMILELSNGGKDMESYGFFNAVEAYSLLQQTACSLAVAESALQFEHRDLHWGNLLITKIDNNKSLSYCIDGREVELSTEGIEVSIIDFTLSRITYDGVCIFNDLSLDPDLFSASGDYQFEIYKMMQEHNGNEWQCFKPYSNVLWLHYVLDKMINSLRYTYPNTKVHKKIIAKFRRLKRNILNYSSVTDFVKNEILK